LQLLVGQYQWVGEQLEGEGCQGSRVIL